MRTLGNSAVVFAALVLLGSAAVAQSSPKDSDASQQPAHTTRSIEDSLKLSQSPGPPAEDTAHTAPVLWISSMEVLRSTHSPQLDVVRVRGLASTDGWESTELIPLTKGVPYDGILDLALVAEAPTDQTASTGFAEVEAVFAIEPGHPFKGIRVHGATNRLSLNTLPGFVETATPPIDCTACTGKYFVPKGGALPAGKTAADVVREESLPKTLRVVRNSEGMGRLDSDPNRITIILDDNDRIALVFWD
jgi:hypothetical protein